jgi:signal transduction histidine kinase
MMAFQSNKWRIIVLPLCLIPLLGMMGWLTWRLEIRERASADNEQRVQLASWTQLAIREIDAFGTSFLADEQSRWNDLHDLMDEGGSVDPGQNRLLGNLALTTLSENKPNYVRGYLMILPDGRIDSPASDPSWLAQVRANPQLGTELLVSMKEHGKELGQGEEILGSFVIFWQGHDLFALRKAHSLHGPCMEGIAFGWPELRQTLLQRVGNKLPKCDIYPLWQALDHSDADGVKSQILPIVFSPGDELVEGTKPNLAILHQSLIIAWGILLCSVAGLVVLVMALIRLERKQRDFVSTVTHELRTPLTTLSLHAEMLEEGLVAEEKKPNYYASMLSECRRLDHLIENVLSYARLQRGGARPKRDSVTGEELFDPIAEQMREQLKKANVSFSYTISHPARVRLIHTDAMAVEQIISNLTTNAIKYASEVPQPEVQLQVVLDMHSVLVWVRDNGPGIPPKMKRQIFQPFRRLDNALGSRQPGVGLGLAYSRDLARSLGGNLKLESSSLGGATFLLVLPLSL